MRTNLFYLSSVFLSLSSLSFALPGPSPAGRPLAPRAQPTSWSLPHRVSIESPIQPAGANARALEASKRQNVQIPFQFCPEFFNNDPKLCSDCGGDSKVKGTCDNLLVSGDQRQCPGFNPCRGYYCKCSDSGGPDHSPRVTMTTVIGGKTGTAVWEPMTLDEYKGLRASTTITLTESATQSGKNELETVAAVVFAGGVAWYLASQSGAGAAALAIQPPTQRPEGSREDDSRCKKDPKDKCDSCGGGTPLGLCASGDKVGCPCEDQECPKDGPPQCSVTDCAGNDNGLQCTVAGKLKGCQCCPSTPPDCFSKECNGNNDNKCQADKYKGCGCDREFGPEDPAIDAPWQDIPSDEAMKSAAAACVAKLWGGNVKKVPGYQEPKQEGPWCVHGAAPNQPREPKEYCQCGDGYKTMYSVTAGPTPCPWSPSSTGVLVTFSTPAPKPAPTTKAPEPPSTPKPPTPPTTPTPPTPPTPPSPPCNHGWCGAPFCSPECGPA